MSLSVEESQLLVKIKGLILDYGERFWSKDQSVKIIQHIEDGLNPEYKLD